MTPSLNACASLRGSPRRRRDDAAPIYGRAAGDRRHVRRSARPLLDRRTALLPQLCLVPLNPLVMYVNLGLPRALVLFVVADPLHAVFSLPTLSDTLATDALDLENELATINQVALRGSIGTPAVLEL